MKHFYCIVGLKLFSHMYGRKCRENEGRTSSTVALVQHTKRVVAVRCVLSTGNARRGSGEGAASAECRKRTDCEVSGPDLFTNGCNQILHGPVYWRAGQGEDC